MEADITFLSPVQSLPREICKHSHFAADLNLKYFLYLFVSSYNVCRLESISLRDL